MNPLSVDIDVGSRGNTAYLMRPDGEKYSHFTVQNNRGGAKILIDKIVSVLTTMGLEQVVIDMKATGIYGENLVYALREDGALGRFQRKIHVLNPKQVSKFRSCTNRLISFQKSAKSSDGTNSLSGIDRYLIVFGKRPHKNSCKRQIVTA